MTAYHPVVSQIIKLLKNNGCWFETFEHQPVRTSEEAAQIRTGYELKHGAKALIIRVKKSRSDKRFVMLVFPANCKFDKTKVREVLEAKDIRFATSDEVNKMTSGVQPGGVPPLGNLFDLPVYVAPELFQNERIVFNAGDRRFSIAMKSSDYRHLVRPMLVDIL